jgi:hypothetical protein
MYLLFSQLDLTCTHALMRVVVLTIIIKWIYPLMIFCSYPLWNWKIWKRETCKLWMWTILALDFETGSRIVAFAFAFLGLCSCVVSESIWHTHTHIQHISTVYPPIYCRILQWHKSKPDARLPNVQIFGRRAHAKLSLPGVDTSTHHEPHQDRTREKTSS